MDMTNGALRRAGAAARSEPARAVHAVPETTAGPLVIDPLVIGRRVRHLRHARGMTLEGLGREVGRAASQISMLENGLREPRLSLLGAIAGVLKVPLDALLDTAPPTRRAALEVELERAQRGPLFAALGVPSVKVGRSLPTDALEAIVALQSEVRRQLAQKAATPEEARRANAALRQQMREQDNYFADLEQDARKLLGMIGHTTGPLSQREVGDLAAHLGFTLHHVAYLPASTRSVTDLMHRRVYLGHVGDDPRSVVLQALAGHALGHDEPADYGELLRQRVETNYLAAAMLLPEDSAVAVLAEARRTRTLAVDDLRDTFGVSYEVAAHRFTNLATRHLGIPVHFMKVERGGALHKAYENDGVVLPCDPLGAVEGRQVCRWWTARRVFDVEDRLNPYHQYTDTPSGTYWCTSRVQSSAEGEFSVSVGVPFAHVRWFAGRETTERAASTCPDPRCCRHAPPDLADRWAGLVRPSTRTHASLLATLPTGAYLGVDQTMVLEFLEHHAPTAD